MGKMDYYRGDGGELLRRVGRGDRQAFEELYRMFYPVARGFLIRSRGFPMAEHDLDSQAQEVFVRLWQFRLRYDGRSSAKTYVLGFAKNVSREAWRARVRDAQSRTGELMEYSTRSRRDDLSEPEQMVQERQLAQAIERAKAGLSAKEVQAIELVGIRGLSIKEAARLAKCPGPVLRRRLHEARKRLWAVLGRLVSQSMSIDDT